MWQVESDRQRVATMQTTMQTNLKHHLALQTERVKGARERLDALSPLQILKRGYAIVRDLDTSTVVSSIGDTQPGHLLEVRVTDGAFVARVERQARKQP